MTTTTKTETVGAFMVITETKGSGWVRVQLLKAGKATLALGNYSSKDVANDTDWEFKPLHDATEGFRKEAAWRMNRAAKNARYAKRQGITAAQIDAWK